MVKKEIQKDVKDTCIQALLLAGCVTFSKSFAHAGPQFLYL